MVTLINKRIEDEGVRDICRDYGDKPDELLEILHAVQAAQGFVSEPALRTIAYALNLSRAEVHGVVSFYHDYKREAQAKTTVKICRAEACQAVGANTLIASAEAVFETKMGAHNTDVALEATYCLGNCALGPAVMIDDNLYGRVDIAKLKTIVEANS